MTSLSETEIQRAIGILDSLNDKLVGILGDEDQTHRGGFFCLMDDVLPAKPPRAFVQIGRIVNEEKSESYREHAFEKVVRLVVEHRDHSSSWQSRNPDNGEYGGGIRISIGDIGFAMSISGHLEECDEALMLALAVQMSWLASAQAYARAANGTVSKYLYRLLSA